MSEMKRSLGRAARVLGSLSLMVTMVHCGGTSTVIPPSASGLIVTTITLPDGVVGAEYSATLAASGGTPPYTWSISSGSALPSWAALSAGGVISGTPNAAGGSGFLVAVTDSSSRVATQSL